MDRKLVWTEKASSDIEAIVRYIARRDPKAAARIGLGIYDRAQILFQQSRSGNNSGRVTGRRLAKAYFPAMENCLRNSWRRHHHRQSVAGSDS